MAQSNSPRRRLTSAIVPALGAAGLAGLVALGVVAYRGFAPPDLPPGCVITSPPNVGGPISLVGADGRRVTEAQFADAPTLLYFGFTHCPDVCPATMYLLGGALAAMGDEAEGVHTALITVDPARDTPEALGAYVRADGFPRGLVGLTGASADVEAAVRAFHVYVSAEAPRDGAYNVDHSSFLYVMDRNWRVQALIATPQIRTVADMRRCLSAALGAARIG